MPDPIPAPSPIATSEPCDRDLLTRWCRQRDEAAFTTLVERHRSLVLGTAARVVGPDDAEDVAQAVFLALAQGGDRIRVGTSLAGWLYVAARNAALNQREASLARQQREREAAHIAHQPVTVPAWNEALHAGLAVLDERERTALVLHHLEGLPLSEVAAQLQAKPGTVGSWLARGRAQLERHLRRSGVALPAAGVVVLLGDEATAASAATTTFAAVPASVLASAATAGQATGPATLLAASISTTGLAVGGGLGLFKAIGLGAAALLLLLVGTASAAVAFDWFRSPSYGPIDEVLEQAITLGFPDPDDAELHLGDLSCTPAGTRLVARYYTQAPRLHLRLEDGSWLVGGWLPLPADQVTAAPPAVRAKRFLAELKERQRDGYPYWLATDLCRDDTDSSLWNYGNAAMMAEPFTDGFLAGQTTDLTTAPGMVWPVVLAEMGMPGMRAAIRWWEIPSRTKPGPDRSSSILTTTMEDLSGPPSWSLDATAALPPSMSAEFTSFANTAQALRGRFAAWFRLRWSLAETNDERQRWRQAMTAILPLRRQGAPTVEPEVWDGWLQEHGVDPSLVPLVSTAADWEFTCDLDTQARRGLPDTGLAARLA